MPAPPKIMAVLNLTPDSFSDGGRWQHLPNLLQTVERYLALGVDVLDIGGESTRPGAPLVSADEELKRVMPAVTAILERFPEAYISIDTQKAAVASEALQAGVRMVNDVSGLQADPALANVVAKADAELVIMHMIMSPPQPGPAPTSQETQPHNYPLPPGEVELGRGGNESDIYLGSRLMPDDVDVVSNVAAFLKRQAEHAVTAGVSSQKIWIDPGFGFGKTVRQNLQLLKQLHRFQELGYPLLAGISRKSFLTLKGFKESAIEVPPDKREALTAAALSACISGGAQMVRLHDIDTQLPVLRFLQALAQA